jgi:hypothetical protein
MIVLLESNATNMAIETQIMAGKLTTWEIQKTTIFQTFARFNGTTTLARNASSYLPVTRILARSANRELHFKTLTYETTQHLTKQ